MASVWPSGERASVTAPPTASSGYLSNPGLSGANDAKGGSVGVICWPVGSATGFGGPSSGSGASRPMHPATRIVTITHATAGITIFLDIGNILPFCRHDPSDQALPLE